MSSQIIDSRTDNAFKSITFSGYSLKSAVSKLAQSILNKDIESGCYWGAELICAGHLSELWEELISIVNKHIGASKPLVIVYFSTRLKEFKKTANTTYFGKNLDLRNEDFVRGLFAEIIAVLSVVPKTTGMTYMKPQKDSYTMIDISSRCVAPNSKFADIVWEEGDPLHFRQPINEIIYQLIDNDGSIYNCCYWIEWFIKFIELCRKNKLQTSITPRYFMPLKSNHNSHPIWLVWQALWSYSRRRKHKIYTAVIQALLDMFCLKFSPSVIKKRKSAFYSAINFLKQDYSGTQPLLSDECKNTVKTAVEKINIVYSQISKSQQGTKLVQTDSKSSTSCSLKRLEIMGNLDKTFRNGL